jgi:hypothetical protein
MRQETNGNQEEEGVRSGVATATGAVPVVQGFVVGTATATNFPTMTTTTRRPYKGFSTSICDLFHGSHPLHKEDCCAFACCGILAHDKTQYLLQQTQQQSSSGANGNGGGDDDDDDDRSVLARGELLSLRVIQKSSLVHLVLQFFVVPCLLIFAMVTAGDRITNVEQNELVTSWILVILFFYVIVISIKYRCDRVKFRRQMAELAASTSGSSGGISGGDSRGGVYGSVNPYRQGGAGAGGGRMDQSYESQSCCEAHCAYGMCGCYPRDNYYAQGLNVPQQSDCCYTLMQMVSDVCCGICCGCWFQFWGCCATAQEAREMKLLVGNGIESVKGDANTSDKMQLDYVTYQPYSAYKHKLENLRNEQVSSLAQHYTNVSKLSKLLLKALLGVVVCLLIVGLFDLVGGGGFQLWNLAVVVATFCQAFLILYFVHWKWNRFDLSFDAIVKYFAAGFLLTTGLAMAFEMVESLGLQFIMYILVLILEGDTIAAQIEQDQQEANGGQEDQQQPSIMDTFSADYPAIVILFLAFNAYAVAALVEEMCKYFGYWMVEHPDFMGNPIGNRSTQSVGAGITIAMVAVALGFACCENLIYIFVYTGGGVQMEFATLFMRSLFPVHPLCAAIQSIGVCERDLENNSSRGIGQIMWPAIILHGTFDFSLMVLGYLNPAGEEDENNQDMSSDAVMLTLLSFAICFVLVVAGFVYYFSKAKAQNGRLAALDANAVSLALDSSSRLV